MPIRKNDSNWGYAGVRENAETYHREIGKMLNEESIQYVFTYGELAEIVAEEGERNMIQEKYSHLIVKPR